MVNTKEQFTIDLIPKVITVYNNPDLVEEIITGKIKPNEDIEALAK